MDNDELNQPGTDDAQDDEGEGSPENLDDGEISDGLDEGSENGIEDGNEGASDDETAASSSQAQVRQPSRAQERIRRQQEELQRERQARESVERERQQLMQQLEQQRTNAEQSRQQQYLESLDPMERQNYQLQTQMEQIRREMQASQFAQADLTDKMAFQQRVTSNPMLAKYSERVESALQDMRNKGQTAPRESILKFLVGEEVLNKAPGAVQKATRAAANRSSAKPLRARGNAAANTQDADGDLEARLSNLSF
jgi:hypothetical protein